MRKTMAAVVCMFLAAVLAGPVRAQDPEVVKLQKAVQDLQTQVQSLQRTVEAQQATINALQAKMEATSHQPAPAAVSRSARTTPAAPLPSVAEELYKSGLADYDAHRNGSAGRSFSKILRDYADYDLAGNAEFYLGEIEYRQSNYARAVLDYDKVLKQWPNCDKAAAAHLKKGLSLLELGEKEDGVQELRTLIESYPQSPEAIQAKNRLAQLGQ